MIEITNNIVTMTREEALKIAIDALEFYADEGMWGKSNQNHFNRCVYTDCNIIKSHQYRGVWHNNSMVGGKTAKQALEKIK